MDEYYTVDVPAAPLTKDALVAGIELLLTYVGQRPFRFHTYPFWSSAIRKSCLRLEAIPSAPAPWEPPRAPDKPPLAW